MDAKWQLQDAKARFSELVDDALTQGPQIVTRRGVDAVVVVKLEDWVNLRKRALPTAKELLLGDGPRFELDIPLRKSWRLRPPPDLG